MLANPAVQAGRATRFPDLANWAPTLGIGPQDPRTPGLFLLQLSFQESGVRQHI